MLHWFLRFFSDFTEFIENFALFRTNVIRIFRAWIELKINNYFTFLLQLMFRKEILVLAQIFLEISSN